MPTTKPAKLPRRIIWFTWKDLTHPLAGGAEVINEEIARRLAADGVELTLVVGGYDGCVHDETIHGYRVIRLGSRYSLYWHAWQYYRKHLRGTADMVIDEVNTAPFFAAWYAGRNVPVIMFYHMLCRQIWFYQMPKAVAWIGYLAEPLYLRSLSRLPAIAMSDSTRRDLMRHGYRSDRIHLVGEAIHMAPLRNLRSGRKYRRPTLLSFGSVRAMKRTLDQVKAFELAKAAQPELRLIIAGDMSDRYGQMVRRYVAASQYAADIECLGAVSRAKKTELMQRCHLLLAASVKEGWCLVVSEANSQGTPAVAYEVDGLRDSVRPGTTGLLCRPQPAAMAAGIEQLLADPALYEQLRAAAWQWSHELTFEHTYADFCRALLSGHQTGD